ncbi:ankyrin repeat domain-containing protein [Endozoicomonas sp. SM1973]|uniref:Ankyrin repeat domain-containing protein n=1 Tax=Spartinivicinus marinus TaxID=2994442 RepID=A0A853I6A6_9GAMM|nr:ankyrin repeat domain-containing protein [Spartinivicinus marinus]MCX4028002.1 ankyrin repeat domain-containing protein [Spartinivicinus marinus]NYZ68279.1 ankyrin repeat domain-containing protein [Spartinivicinus marinus]
MPQAVSSFSSTFFNNVYQPTYDPNHSQQGLNDSESIGIRYLPNLHKDLSSFRHSPDFSKFEQEYRQNLTALKRLAQDWQIDCNQAFSTLENRLFDNPAYFGPMIDTLYGMGKESMDELVGLFQNDKIPLHTRKNALQNLAQGVTVCSEGTLSNILVTARELALAAGGIAESLQYSKEKSIEQIIAGFVRKQHNPKKTYEIHYVNAYMNALAKQFGLREIKDRYTSEVAVTSENVKAAYREVFEKLSPRVVIESLLQPLNEEIESAWQQYKTLRGEAVSKPISFEDYSADIFTTDEHTSLHQKIETALDQMDRKLGLAPGESHVIKHEDLFILNDDSLSLQPGTTLAALSLTRFLETQNWLSETAELAYFSANSSLAPNQLSVASFTTLKQPTAEIIKKGELFFIQTFVPNSPQQELRLLTAKDLIDLVPDYWPTGNDHQNDCINLVSEAINNTRNTEYLLDLPPKILTASNQWQHFFDRLSSKQTNDYIERHTDALADIIKQAPQGTLARGLMSWALNTKNSNWVEHLLTINVSPNTRLEKQQTPLMIAASAGQFDIVETLLVSGAELNSTTVDGKTPAMLAAENGHADILDLLLTNDKRNIESRDQSGNTSLMLAAAQGHIQAIKVLLQHQARVDSSNSYSRSTTPLMLAAEAGHYKAVELLAKNKASTERLNEYGNTPLMLAAGAGHPEVVNALLKYGADIESYTQPQDYTPLMKAAANGEVAIVGLLLRRGANLHATSWDERTALMHAAKNDQSEVIRLLIENKAKLEAEDDEGKTALMIAAEKNSLNAAKVLLELGAKPNHFGLRKTWHPLTLAAKKGHLAMVKLLLENGADIKARSKLHSAEHYARKHGHLETAEFLASYAFHE